MVEPAYLLQGIPTKLRVSISADAERQNLSLMDTIRTVLCAHYDLDCPPRGSGYRPERDEGSERMVLRMSQELFAAIKADAKETGLTMRALILNALDAHYTEVPA
jgi:hypothetical protein